jgi:hypothetical protein
LSPPWLAIQTETLANDELDVANPLDQSSATRTIDGTF